MTVPEFTEIVKAATPFALLYIGWQSHRANAHAKKVGEVVERLELNTNSKMDALLQATNAASYQAGKDAEKAENG